MTIPTVRRSHASIPSSNTALGHELSDLDSDRSDGDVELDDVDIDERSDEEEDHATHKLLRAAPIATDVLADNPQAILPYNHHGFAVIIVCIN